MRIIVVALAIYETIEILVIKYQVDNIIKQINFSIWFLFDDIDSLLYLIMKNGYLAFIVGFTLCFIIVPNQKLHTVVFY